MIWVLFLILNLHLWAHDLALGELRYFSPDEATLALLEKKKISSKEGEKFLQTMLESFEGNGQQGNWEIRYSKVDKLPSGAMASITPELGKEKLIINLKITPQGLTHPAVLLEEFIHLDQITSTIGYNPFFNHPYQWAETVANAKLGSLPAMEKLARMELLSVKRLPEYISLGNFTDYFGYTVSPELASYIKARDAHAQKVYDEVAKAARADMKKRTKLWEERKVEFDQLEKAPEKLNDLVAKNDRKGVKKVIEKYLPWELMEPSEAHSWKVWLSSLEKPDKKNAKVIFRGMDDDLIIKTPSGEPGFFSTVLTKNQGNYTRRLRSLQTMRERFGVLPKNDLVKGVVESPSLLTIMKNHASDPVGSPFLSFSSHDVAVGFGYEKRIAVMVDEKRILPNAMAWGFLHEREMLVPLVVFPDEVIHFEDVSKKSAIVSSEFIARVEAKLGRPLSEKELKKPFGNQEFIQQGYNRIKELMLDPEKISPPKIPGCSLDPKDCQCVFKTLSSLLK